MNTNVESVVAQLLRALKVPFTDPGLRQQLVQHPFFPSLLSISDTLSKYGVENESFRIELLDRVPLPCLAYCKGAPVGEGFVLVEAIDGETVTIVEKKRHTLSREAFLGTWQKVVLIAESDPESGEPGYAGHRKAERRRQMIRLLMSVLGALSGIALLVTWAMVVPEALTIPAGILIITKLAGLSITLLLIAHDFGKSGRIVREFCSAFRKGGCDGVLESKGASIGPVRWSEVGFWYFASSTLFLLYPGLPLESKLPWLYLGALVVSPYILYSLYYQARVVRQWCPLCVAVQGVLLAEAVQAVWWHPNLTGPDTSLIGAATICLILPALGWYLLKPLLRIAKDAPGLEVSYKRMLSNPDYFQFLLTQQPEAPEGWERLGIEVGKPGARQTILKVCNPYCPPCARAHGVLKELMRNNGDIGLHILFTATPAEGDRGGPPARHLLAIAAGGDSTLTEKALDDWYGAPEKNYNAFSARYPVREDLDGGNAQLSAMQAWCKEASITYTPTIFVNGRRLPEGYSVDGLGNVMPLSPGSGSPATASAPQTP